MIAFWFRGDRAEKKLNDRRDPRQSNLYDIAHDVRVMRAARAVAHGASQQPEKSFQISGDPVDKRGAVGKMRRLMSVGRAGSLNPPGRRGEVERKAVENHEADLSAAQEAPQARARIPEAHVDPGGQENRQGASRQGSQEPLRANGRQVANFRPVENAALSHLSDGLLTGAGSTRRA